MLVQNNSAAPVNLYLRDGQRYHIAAGRQISLPDSYTSLLDDNTTTIALFNTGILSALTDAGAPFPNFPSTVNSADSKAGRQFSMGGLYGSAGDPYPSGDSLAAIRAAMGVYTSNTPSQYYQGAYRGAQADFAYLKDQSPAMRDAAINAALFPQAWTASTVIATGAYRSRLNPDGVLYKATTGGTTGTGEPSWNSTIGATTTDGTVTWTAEKGPWYVDTGGVREFRSLNNAQLGAGGAFSLGVIPWDMRNNDSLIVSVTSMQNFTSGPVNFNDIAAAGNGGGSTTPGFCLVPTGQTTFNDFSLRISDGGGAGNLRRVQHLDTGGVAQNRHGDGNRRTSTFCIDGVLKRIYLLSDGAPRNQVNNYSTPTATNVIGWDGDISGCSGSTQSASPFVWGGIPSGLVMPATTYELSAQRLDILVLPGRGLPADLISIGQWFHNRGEGLLPRSLLV